MKAVNPIATGYQPRTVSEDAMIDDSLRKCPKMLPVNINDDNQIAAQLYAAGMKDQKPGQIYSLGISRREILTLSATELKARVAVARERAEREAPEPRASLTFSGPKPEVSRVFMVG